MYESQDPALLKDGRDCLAGLRYGVIIAVTIISPDGNRAIIEPCATVTKTWELHVLDNRPIPGNQQSPESLQLEMVTITGVGVSPLKTLVGPWSLSAPTNLQRMRDKKA